MERVVRLTLLGLLLAFVSAAPVKEDWDIYSFHINSTVTSRYATTVVTSRVVNRVDAPKEIHFQVRIPKNAFISNFKMRIEGQMYDGVVKAKEQAQQQYTEAVSRGESAGVVSSVGRTLEEFKTSVTVAALQKVTFELTYEELLKRTLGKYELQIHARPMQPVKDFKMDVYINEKPGITFVQVKGGLSTNALANAITKTHAHNQAWVHFYPTEQQQIMCDSCGPQGMNGDLVIAYDVNRDASLGDVKVSGGYFVHHFAPSGLPRIPKNVVFIIDRSGSMHGKKMHQTRLALLHILGDLAEEDFFGLVIFDSSVSSWKRELSQATSENLAAAKEFVRRIRDAGATDINAAVLEGAEMLKRQPREGSASLLILLTDGDPTSGVTNLERIQANVRKSINEKYPLYCLGFGFDVNFEFLEKMALENNGAARRIYQDSDADLQLQGFYEEVANPLLTDVIMIYVGGTNLTKTNFSQYYNGSEIVVAGQITDNNIDTFIPRVVALSKSTKMEFESEKDSRPEPTGTISDHHHLQRVWAYLTVKQLLDKELQLADAEKENVKKEALELSLKYSFVTPHTSMVVTKPPGENTQVLHKPKEGERPMMSAGRTGLGPGSGGTQSRGFGGHAVLLSSGAMDSPPDMGIVGYGGIAMDYSYDDVDVSDDLMMITHEPADFDVPYQAPTTTEAPRTTKVPFYHKFLLGAENQTLPLCYDVSAKHLKLLRDPDTGLSVNGKLRRSLQGGFQKIVIHYKNQHIEVNTDSITVRDGQLVGAFNWGQDHTTAGSVTLILRDNEMDVSIGDTRIVILLHQNKGEKLLWPVLRQFPSGNNTEGILVAKPAVYSILQENSITAKLRIHNMEVIAPRTPAVDYSVTSAPTLDCWSVSPELALQREPSDFLVTQL